MSRNRIIAVGLTAGLLILSQVHSSEASGDREADHQALRELLVRATSAINTRDMDTLVTCLAEPFVFTLADQTVITNRAGLRAYYDRILDDPKTIVTKLATAPEADILTRFVAENTGYCYGRGVDTYTLKNGHVVRIGNRWTGVVLKEDGAWKVCAVHVGVNFMDNPVLDYKAMPFWRKLAVYLRLASPPGE
jgi:hypothetical protein